MPSSRFTASSSPSAWTEPAYGPKVRAIQMAFEEAQVAEGWLNRQNDLKVIRRYRDDWDGMGASAPQPQLIDAAIRLLDSMKYRESISPPSAVSGTPMGHI